jgi:hypothetical protein
VLEYDIMLGSKKWGITIRHRYMGSNVNVIYVMDGLRFGQIPRYVSVYHSRMNYKCFGT